MHMIYGYGGWSWMIIIMIINLLILFSIGIFIIRYFVQGSKKVKQTPVNILNEQLVKGELSEDDYDRLKRKLRDHK